MLKFLHTADLHIDRPFEGMGHLPQELRRRVRNSTYQTVENIVDVAIREAVDFIIIAGDVFDAGNPSLRGQLFFNQQMNRLKPYGIHVYIIRGNHDYEHRLWTSDDNHIHIFDHRVSSKVFESDGAKVKLYGFSYATRHVQKDMVQDYIKDDEAADLHIGILHGAEASGNQLKDTYAPFSLKAMTDCSFDYWALGHIHKRQILNEDPSIVYPGNPQGLSKKETGEKGVYIVTTQQNHALQRQFIPLHDVIWNEIDVDIEQVESVQTLMDMLLRKKEALRNMKEGTLLTINVTGSGPLYRAFNNGELIEQLYDALTDGEEERQDFVWVIDIVNHTLPEYDRQVLKETDHFLGDLLQVSDEQETIMEWLQPLYNHRRMRKSLAAPTKDEEASIKEQAERLIIETLIRGEAESDEV